MKNQNQSTLLLVGLLFIAGSILSVNLPAQTITFSGNVTDIDTGEPLVYASVGLKDQAIGTITNLAGDFDLHIPEGIQADKIIISTLGYFDYVVNIENAISAEKLKIELQPGHIILDEVLVTEELSAKNLLKIAIANIEINYPMNPVEMDGFYRDTKRVNDEYVGLLEAAVKIYDKDYSKPRDHTKLRERVALVEVRRTIDYDYSLNKYFSDYNVMEDLLLENLVKYRTFNNEEEFYQALNRRKVPGYNNIPINLVYIEMKGYSLKVYIDDDYGIRKVIFLWGDGAETLYSSRKNRKLENHMVRLEKTIEFQEYNGKLYLKYIAAHSQNNWLNRKSSELNLTTERDQALLINRINNKNPQWIDNKNKMKRYGLQYQHKAYNRSFWANYNTIKELPLSEQAAFDLEKLFSLEEQFESFE